MKFLLLTYEYPPFHGGIANYLSNLMKTAPAGVEVIVDVPSPKEHWLKTIWRFDAKVKKEKPDLLAVSHVLPAGYIALKMRTWNKTPFLVFTHGTDILNARAKSWKHFWLRYILRRAKFVIANSRYTATLLHEEGIGHVEIIPPSITNDLTPTLSLNKERGDRIISIGRLIPRKGFDTLIKAMPLIIKEVPNAHLTIIGRGSYYDELIRLAHELRVEKFVEILVDADDACKRECLATADVFALAARKVGNDVEGFGIVTLEASASGLPVVVTNSGGAAEPVVSGVTGMVAPCDDLETFSAIIIKLLNNKDEAKKMGTAGREYVTKEYSLEVIGKRFWDHVTKIHPSP